MSFPVFVQLTVMTRNRTGASLKEGLIDINLSQVTSFGGAKSGAFSLLSFGDGSTVVVKEGRNEIRHLLHEEIAKIASAGGPR